MLCKIYLYIYLFFVIFEASLFYQPYPAQTVLGPFLLSLYGSTLQPLCAVSMSFQDPIKIWQYFYNIYVSPSVHVLDDLMAFWSTKLKRYLQKMVCNNTVVLTACLVSPDNKICCQKLLLI